MEPYRRDLKQPARNLRLNMTDAEQHLWWRIRNKQICGAQFYRQKPLLSFIVDFYCPKAKLVVELDGSQHVEPEYLARDNERDMLLVKAGLKVLRFDDRQVLRETDAVVGEIFQVVEDRLFGANPPSPPFCKGGNCISPPL